MSRRIAFAVLVLIVAVGSVAAYNDLPGSVIAPNDRSFEYTGPRYAVRPITKIHVTGSPYPPNTRPIDGPSVLSAGRLGEGDQPGRLRVGPSLHPTGGAGAPKVSSREIRGALDGVVRNLGL